MRSLQVGVAWMGVALLGGAAVLASCARPGSPTGGPRDMIPPMIAGTWPDTFETVEATRDPVKILFSERISERPTEGTLDAAVLVSPFTGEHRVKNTRSGLEINVIGGFQPGLVYRVRVLPTIKDLFNNPMEGPFELVFSTGAEYETNVIAGIVKDRLSGEAVQGARVEARAGGVENPPVYIAVTDTAGVFALRYLPAGAYQISLYEDVNRNTEVDFAELQGDTVGSLGLQPPGADTVVLREVRLLRPDTTPARLIRVEALDSLILRLAFDDFLDAEGSLDEFQVSVAPEEGPGPAVDRLIWPRQLDSIRAVADSVAAEERRLAVVDSLGVVADSLTQILAGLQAAGDFQGADSIGTELELLQERMAPPEAPEAPRGGAAAEVPAEPPPILPQQEFFVILAEPLAPDQLFQATVGGVLNINGLGGGGGESSFTWEPPEPPPSEEADTAGVVPDTAAALPDTAVVPDTLVVLPDTSSVPPGSSSAPPGEGVKPSPLVGRRWQSPPGPIRRFP